MPEPDRSSTSRCVRCGQPIDTGYLVALPLEAAPRLRHWICPRPTPTPPADDDRWAPYGDDAA